jgi:hypothetical protein
MTAYHALELLLVAGAVGAAAWHVYRRWRRQHAPHASCGGCDKDGCRAPPRE